MDKTMTLVLAGIVAMSLIASSQGIEISISIPASILTDGDVELYPVDSPNCPLFPRRQWSNNTWVFKTNIASLQHAESICLITSSGKVGIKKFIPSAEQNLTITIYDVPAPLLIEDEGPTISWSVQLPEEIANFMQDVELYADGTRLSKDQTLNWMPSVAYAKIYFDEEKLHWVLSKLL
jgi:hypothetical protein